MKKQQLNVVWHILFKKIYILSLYIQNNSPQFPSIGEEVGGGCCDAAGEQTGHSRCSKERGQHQRRSTIGGGEGELDFIYDFIYSGVLSWNTVYTRHSLYPVDPVHVMPPTAVSGSLLWVQWQEWIQHGGAHDPAGWVGHPHTSTQMLNESAMWEHCYIPRWDNIYCLFLQVVGYPAGSTMSGHTSADRPLNQQRGLLSIKKPYII